MVTFYKTLKQVCLASLNNTELCSVNLWKMIRSVTFGNLFTFNGIQFSYVKNVYESVRELFRGMKWD